MYKNSSSHRKPSAFGRLIRMVFSVVVLSALVLGISLGVKSLYGTDAQTLALKLKPVLQSFNINIDEKKIGDVAGKFVERVSQTDLGSGISTSRYTEQIDNNTVSDSNDSKKVVVNSLAILSDIHDGIENLNKSLTLAKSKGVKTVFILGDTTNYGDLDSLNKVKNVLEKSGIEYYLIPGDHDIAQTSSTKNFSEVFGPINQVILLSGGKFVLFNNAFNYTKLSVSEVMWLENNIVGADFILLSQPLYTEGLSPFFEKIYMGSTPTDPDSDDLKQKQEEVRDQGVALLNLIRSENNVKAVFSGELHKSSELTDKSRNTLKHFVVGAVSNTVNEYPQNIIQTPRFSLLFIYDDGTYKVEDVVID